MLNNSFELPSFKIESVPLIISYPDVLLFNNAFLKLEIKISTSDLGINPKYNEESFLLSLLSFFNFKI